MLHGANSLRLTVGQVFVVQVHGNRPRWQHDDSYADGDRVRGDELCDEKLLADGAHRGGFFNLRALANGDRVDIGFGWDSWSQVTLYEGAPGQW